MLILLLEAEFVVHFPERRVEFREEQLSGCGFEDCLSILADRVDRD